MNTRRNSKKTIIEFLIAIPLLLMACSLSSVIPSIGNKANQVETQVAPTLQQLGTQGAQAVNQATSTEVSTMAPSGTATPNPTPTPQPILLTPSVQLPQAFTYAGVQFNVTKAVITNEVSDTDPSIDPTNTYARVTIKVVNPTTLDVKFPDGTLHSDPR